MTPEQMGVTSWSATPSGENTVIEITYKGRTRQIQVSTSVWTSRRGPVFRYLVQLDSYLEHGSNQPNIPR